MSYLGGMSVGLSMLAVGLMKAYLHMISAGTLHMTTCLGREVTLRTSGPVFQNAHCWGCYVAVAGALVVGVAMFGRLRSTKAASLRV